MTNNFENMNLRDFIWESEEHKFEPKENRHEKVVKGKKKEATEKENLKKKKKAASSIINSEDYRRKKAEAEHADNISNLEADAE